MIHDVFDPATRSRVMSRVKGRDTEPELFVRSLLHRMGYRFRLHRRDLPGTPDIVLPRHRAVIFVHGCFWHQHPGCAKAGIPVTRREFWVAKFDATRLRDQRAFEELTAAGWRVLVVWQCELRDAEALRPRLSAFLPR